MKARDHDADCALYPVHWMRHALAATQMAMSGEQGADRLSASSLLNAFDHYLQQPGWESVTLDDIADYASLMDSEKFGGTCNCKGRSQLEW